jgi:hypothetical protein
MSFKEYLAPIYRLGLFYSQRVQNHKNPVLFLENKPCAVTFAVPKIRVKNAYNSTISKKRKRNYQGQE